LNTKNYNSGSLYPANVTSIIQQDYTLQFGKNGYIFGSNEKSTNDDCGQIFRKIQCTQNSLHHPSFRHIHCDDPGCPICYTKYAGQMSDRVTERVQGYKTVYRRHDLYHLIFWSKPPKSGLWATEERPYAALKDAFHEAARLLKLMGVTSAVVWYHPYRIRAFLKQHLRRYRTINGLNGKVGFWKLAHDDVLGLGSIEKYIEFGPHWHAIASGYLMHVRKYSEIEGAGYKKKRYLDSERKVHEVAYYISTHCCREAMKSSIRYYGDISYRMLAREMVEEKIKDVLCQDCKSPMEEWEVDENGDYYRETERGPPVRKIKDKVTEKIKYYIYWIRGTRKPEMFDRHQCMVTRFCPSYDVI
jgi:hypothetical protein